jgi:hypothetical protein
MYVIEQTSVQGTCAALGDATTLIDTGTNFNPDVTVGDIAYNLTDGSQAQVTVINSDVNLTTTALTGGTTNTWAENQVYAIAGLQTPPAFSAAKVGIEGTQVAGGVFRLGLTNQPHIVPSSGTLEHMTTTGRAEPFTTLDYSQVVGEPATATLEMPCTAYNLSLFLLLLFQKGCKENDLGGAINTFEARPYTNSAPIHTCSFIRVMDELTTNMSASSLSHILYGGICKSLTIKGSQNNIITLSAEIVGSWAYAKAAAPSDLTTFQMNLPTVAAWSTLTFPSAVPIKFQNCTTKLGTYGSETAANFDDFSITFTNNATHRYYANSSIKSWVLGKITGEGTIRVPWGDLNHGGNSELINFINGTDYGFRIYNSSIYAAAGASAATVDNTFDLTLNVRATGTNVVTDPEIQTEITFQCVYDGTNQAIRAYAGYTAATLDRLAYEATLTEA